MSGAQFPSTFPPSSGSPPSGPLARLWSRFRSLPIVAQVVLWILLWPLLVALLLVSSPRPSRWRMVAAGAVLLIATPAWAASLTAGGGGLGDEPEPVVAEESEPEAPAEQQPDPEPGPEALPEPSLEPAAEPEPTPEPEPNPNPEVEDEAEPEPGLEPEPATAPEPERALAGDLWIVENIVDGDTVDVRNASVTERVRVIGIDTPERGECGFGPASSALGSLILGQQVRLTAGARDDRDRYDRILRYIDLGDVDAGLHLVEQGLAIARYDSRDGYGRHSRQDAYVAADEANEHVCGVTFASATSGSSRSGASDSQTQHPAATSSGAVKRSTNDICHAPGTTYYDRTTNFTSYDTVDACLASGGRLPKR